MFLWIAFTKDYPIKEIFFENTFLRVSGYPTEESRHTLKHDWTHVPDHQPLSDSCNRQHSEKSVRFLQLVDDDIAWWIDVGTFQ